MGAYGGVRRPKLNGWLLCVARGVLWIAFVTLVTPRLVVVVLVRVADSYPTLELAGALGV